MAALCKAAWCHQQERVSSGHSAMFPTPNHVLGGKYRLVRQLGQGGMGSVWLAEHLTLRSPVAIKLIEPSIAANPEALARFLREAQAAASLRSPHVVQILDHGVDAGVPFIVMEVLEGESLADRLTRLGRLSPAETARVMTQVGRAMTRAHEAGIVHRDLKPDNIYIVHNDEDEVAKVLDFGVAKSNLHGLSNTASSGTRTGAMLGTPYYMSPEQAEGTRSVDQRTDIWAMGVIAWECLLGTRPFDAETLGGLVLAICARDLPTPSRVGPTPPAFDAWFARACARDPAQRFATAKEAAFELRRACEGATAPTAAAGQPPAQLWSPSNGGFAAPMRTASPTMAATSSSLSVASTRSGIPTKKLSGALVAGLLLGLVAVGLGATLLVWGAGSSPPAVPSVAAAAPRPAPDPTVTPAPTAPVPAQASAAVAPSGSPAPVANLPTVAAPRAARPPAAASRIKAPPASVSPARPVAAAPPAAAPPAAPARVNLGI